MKVAELVSLNFVNAQIRYFFVAFVLISLAYEFGIQRRVLIAFAIANALEWAVCKWVMKLYGKGE